MDRRKWEYKKLGEVATCLIGLTYKPTDVVDNGGAIVLRSCNIQNNSLSFEDIVRVSCTIPSHKIVQRGDILMCSRNGSFKLVGKVAEINVINEPMSFGAFMTIIRSEYNKFLFYFFLSNSFRNQLHSGQTSTINQITTKMLNNMSVCVPSLEDQQRIVAELDCLNEMIAVKQEQLKEFDKLAQSIFYDMFGDDGGFEKVKLGDVVEVVSGLVDPNIEPYCSQLHVSPANIVSGTNEIVNCVKAKDEGLISDKYPFKTGMVLYSKIRPNLNKVAVANFDGICSADMYPLTVLPKANNVYITKLLSSKQFLEYAIKNSGRARMPKLNRETLFSYSFKLPPLSLQQQFAEKISAIEAQKELVKQSIAETQHILDYTMDKYFG